MMPTLKMKIIGSKESHDTRSPALLFQFRTTKIKYPGARKTNHEPVNRLMEIVVETISWGEDVLEGRSGVFVICDFIFRETGI